MTYSIITKQNITLLLYLNNYKTNNKTLNFNTNYLDLIYFITIQHLVDQLAYNHYNLLYLTLMLYNIHNLAYNSTLKNFLLGYLLTKVFIQSVAYIFMYHRSHTTASKNEKF